MHRSLVRTWLALMSVVISWACSPSEPEANECRPIPSVTSSATALDTVPDTSRVGPLIWWYVPPADPDAWFAERNATVVYLFHYQPWYLIDIRADSLRIMAADSNVIVNMGASMRGANAGAYDCS